MMMMEAKTMRKTVKKDAHVINMQPKWWYNHGPHTVSKMTVW